MLPSLVLMFFFARKGFCDHFSCRLWSSNHFDVDGWPVVSVFLRYQIVDLDTIYLIFPIYCWPPSLSQISQWELNANSASHIIYQKMTYAQNAESTYTHNVSDTPLPACTCSCALVADTSHLNWNWVQPHIPHGPPCLLP